MTCSRDPVAHAGYQTALASVMAAIVYPNCIIQPPRPLNRPGHTLYLCKSTTLLEQGTTGSLPTTHLLLLPLLNLALTVSNLGKLPGCAGPTRYTATDALSMIDNPGGTPT
eukprot:GHRR01029911.1.p2 GENE.GHRR01029911.1~~GHRR01029911.1.p2  ORF type:complete len:111 (+),score=12.13 GHRR01029911.1:700-1032(+)